MPNLGPLAALFNLRPDRAADYLLAKGFQLSGPYWELDGPAHSHVFTVANLAKLDVLADIKSAVQQAIDKGQTEKWFETQLVDVLKRKGWWGPGVRVDPDTLEAKIIQQGSLRRLQTIYRTNLQTAYMAGRHRQALEQIDRRPWAQYLAIRDHRTRPAHAALHGQVFRLDSPAWAVVAPSNSYNCRCRARYLSDRDLEEKGIKPAADVRILEREPPGRMKYHPLTGEPVGTRPIDPLTGETPDRWLQRGVSVPDPLNPGERLTLWADPGWDHLPGSDGAERALVDKLLAKAETLGDGIKEAVQAEMKAVVAKPIGIAAAAAAARDDCVAWGRVNNRERLIVLDEATGNELARLDGEARAVSFNQAIAAILHDDARSVRLIHNHPSDGSLSEADFGALTNPGVTGIEAAGHGGSRYVALKIGEALNLDVLTRAIDAADRAIRLEIQPSFGAIRMPVDIANWAHHYFMAKGFDEAGLVRYEAILTPEKVAQLEPYQWLVDRCIAAAKRAAENAK